ncbi:YusW family protein [Oceanobacillus massiliensis]|uniref:YusW family protein n=1 Tax=Oceanobacillus massiliensis TaxID=1465765 RepID=UPI000289B737|nr:YusW family protein [Oceanobacillus massiliensis]
MYKKSIGLILVSLLVLALAACGGNESGNEESNSEGTGPAESTGDGTPTDSGQSETTENDSTVSNSNKYTYQFTSFDLEADIEDSNDAVEVDYEMDSDDSEASYLDKIQGIRLNGDEAMEELSNIFSSFEFDQDTPNEEVLNAVMDGFNIPDDAKNVDLEINFADGTEKDYKQ